LILPVYNQEKYIKKIYTCIERQSLKDIEIVFVDDFSTDNSYQIIKELMNIDKRIVYIKNEENRGVFYTRNKGVINARGEYILLVDIDDYLLNDILLKSYETAKIYDLDIVHFYVLAGDFKKNVFWKVLKYRDGIIRGNIPVNNIFFEGTTRNTWDKLIRREVFLKSIDFMDEKYKTDKYVVYNDDVAMFGLFKVAESYGFLEEVGYIYNWAIPNSTTHKYEDKKYINDVFKSCFTIMEYYYEKTENNGFEKRVGYYFFLDKVYKPYLKNIKYLTEGYDYVIKILDLYLNCIYLKEKHKKKLQEFKDEVIKVMPTNNSDHIFINSTNLT
jgi:glycosyltransferase involved in cell wall biosynthesis